MPNPRLTIILAFLFIISPVLATSPCLDFIDRLERTKRAPKLQRAQEEDYFAYSGIKGKNDLGQKRKCEQDSARKYFVIGAIIPLTSESYTEDETGICVPEYCDKQSLELRSSLLRLCKINNWEPSEALVLNDPNATPPREAGFYIIAGIFYGLLTLCAISTFSQNRAKILRLLKKDAGEARANWLFRAFDAVGNTKSLYKTAQEAGQSDQLATFGFLRTLSMFWIAAFHTLRKYRNIFRASGEWPAPTPFLVDFFHTGNTAVGIFLFMAGFLAAYTLAMKSSREGIKVSKFFSDIWHRLIKVYPGYWVAVLLHWMVVPGLMKGTITNRYRGIARFCGEVWVQKLFMIDNLLAHEPNCAIWTWYLDADIQLYPVVILLAYLFVAKKSSKYIAYSATLVLLGLSVASGFIMIHNPSPNHSWYYFPIPRGVHILIGAFLGFQYYEYSKLKLKNNLCTWWENNTIFRFFTRAAGLFLLIFGILAFEKNGGETEFWTGILITLGIALFFVPIANNCTSVVKQFMNLRIFQVSGKLSMGFYLLHFFFVYDAIHKLENLQVEYSSEIIMSTLFKVILYSFLGAFIYHLILEKPLLNIEAHFTRRLRPDKPKVDTTPVQTSTGHFILAETPDLIISPVDNESQVDQEPNRVNDQIEENNQ